MMGLSDGHVTKVPIGRNAQLKALGNGVVPQQAELALRILLHAGTLPTLPTPRTTDTVAELLPTPAANEPGYSGGLVDKEGNPVAHAAQRTYDPNTGRLVQTGLPQAVALLPTPAVNDMDAASARCHEHGEAARLGGGAA